MGPKCLPRRELRAVNRSGPQVYGAFPALLTLDVAGVRRLIDDDGVVIDVRPIERFAAGHIPGALSIELRPQFASWNLIGSYWIL